MIKSEMGYNVVLERIEDLLAMPENIEDPDAKGYLGLNHLADFDKNTWFRDELIEGEESGSSTKIMAEIPEEARKRKTELDLSKK